MNITPNKDNLLTIARLVCILRVIKSLSHLHRLGYLSAYLQLPRLSYNEPGRGDLDMTK